MAPDRTSTGGGWPHLSTIREGFYLLRNLTGMTTGAVCADVGRDGGPSGGTFDRARLTTADPAIGTGGSTGNPHGLAMAAVSG